jgi:hypothetical protein
MQHNPNDPLHNVDAASRELFKLFGQVANQFPRDAVVGAAINTLVNAVRQSHASRDKALGRVDEIAAIMKRIIDNHYDPVTNGRRNVFPFHQIMEMTHFKDEATRRGK